MTLPTNIRPDCSNCHFFMAHEDERQCRKHDFIMPQVGWQVICQDWQHEDCDTLPNFPMQSDILYYYSESKDELRHSELGAFWELQTPLLSVSIREDDQYGWIIFPRNNKHYFPRPDSLVTVMIDGRPCKFQTLLGERGFVKEHHLVKDSNGAMIQSLHTRPVFMLASLESPDLLRDWLDQVMDFKAYEEESFIPNIHALVEVVETDESYIMHADLLAYRQYERR